MSNAKHPPHPHAGQPVLHAGPSLANARLVAILLHGRGASAEDILGLAREFGTADVAYVAPQAFGNAWYPYSFLAPIQQNEPWLSSALRVISNLLHDLQRNGASRDRVVLLGFSQGACLALEFAARQAGRYAGVIGFSGGLIGPLGTPRNYAGSFEETPVFLGCSDADVHIPLDRVHESSSTFRKMGARVDERIYPNMGHTVNSDEVEAATALLTQNM